MISRRQFRKLNGGLNTLKSFRPSRGWHEGIIDPRAPYVLAIPAKDWPKALANLEAGRLTGTAVCQKGSTVLVGADAPIGQKYLLAMAEIAETANTGYWMYLVPHRLESEPENTIVFGLGNWASMAYSAQVEFNGHGAARYSAIARWKLGLVTPEEIADDLVKATRDGFLRKPSSPAVSAEEMARIVAPKWPINKLVRIIEERTKPILGRRRDELRRQEIARERATVNNHARALAAALREETVLVGAAGGNGRGR